MQTIYQKQKHHSESFRLCNVNAQETDDIAGKSTSHFNEQEDYSLLILVINSPYDMLQSVYVYIYTLSSIEASIYATQLQGALYFNDIKLQLFCNVQTLMTDLLARNCKFHEWLFFFCSMMQLFCLGFDLQSTNSCNVILQFHWILTFIVPAVLAIKTQNKYMSYFLQIYHIMQLYAVCFRNKMPSPR